MFWTLYSLQRWRFHHRRVEAIPPVNGDGWTLPHARIAFLPLLPRPRDGPQTTSCSVACCSPPPSRRWSPAHPHSSHNTSQTHQKKSPPNVRTKKNKKASISQSNWRMSRRGIRLKDLQPTFCAGKNPGPRPHTLALIQIDLNSQLSLGVLCWMDEPQR